MPEALWRALESAPSQGQILAEWRLDLGEDLPLLLPYLRPTDRRGETLRCPSPGGEGCPRQILEDAPGRYTAFCGDLPVHCDPVPLERAEVLVYELDLRRLSQALAEALGFEASPAPTRDPCTHRLGLWLPQPTTRWPVYLTLTCGSADFRQSVSELLQGTEGPFLLLSPTPRDSEAEALPWLTRRGAHYLTLCRAVRFEPGGSLQAPNPLATLFPATAEPENAFHSEGDFWHITFRGQTHVLPHRKGLGYIARVLAAPRRECHVRELVQVEAGQALPVGSAGEVADRVALRTYEGRLSELREELQSSEMPLSEKRQDEIWTEIDALEHELARAQGLGRRRRKDKDDHERMRQSVNKAINASLQLLPERSPLARHLAASLILGSVVSYRPEAPIEWAIRLPP